MMQHPRVTIAWAMYGLESALRNLGDGPAERRVRDQFHQLLLALERENALTDPMVAACAARIGLTPSLGQFESAA